MNSYERVFSAFQKQKADHVPIYCGSVSSKIASQVLGREAYVGGGIQQFREALSLWNGKNAHEEFLERSRRDAMDWAERLGFDLVRPAYWRYDKMPSARLDDYTFRYDRKDGSHWVMRYFAQSELYECVEDTALPAQVDDLEPVVEQMERKAAEHEPDVGEYADYLFTMRHFHFQRASNTGGLWLSIPNTDPVWLEAVALRPDLVERLLDAQLTIDLKDIPLLSAIGARFVFGGGDCSGTGGLMYSPKVFREMMVPRLRKISDLCHQLGIFHAFGSDGNFWSVSDALYIDSGIDAHYEADCYSGMDIRSIRSRYPQITVVGGIASHTLDVGSREEVRAQVMEALDAAKEYGGAVVGCSNLVTPSTPIENFDLMMELLHKYK